MIKSGIGTLRGKIHVKHGFPFKGEFFSDRGEFIVLTPGNFYEEGGFKRQQGKEKFYLGEIPAEYIHSKGDLIIAMTEQAQGLLGSTAIVPESGIYLHNQRLGLVQTVEGVTDKDFLFYLFNWKYIRDQIRLTSTGSKVKHTSPERLYDIKVHLPSIESQKQIAKVLSYLDAKISLNNRINAELEAMAKLIYDYWFVQFDFPYDFAQGKPADETSNPKDVKSYKAGGGNMVYNQELKREIPEGWEVKKLKEFAKTGSGGTPLKSKKEYYENATIPWINSGEVNAPFITKAEKFISEEGLKNSSAKIFSKGTILIAMYGATAGKVSLIDLEACTNQAICGINPVQECYKAFLKFGLEDLYSYLVNLSSGSARDNLSQDKIRELNFVVPKINLLELFHENVWPSLSMILLNLKQNQELASLRDWLLPMLMNGQVKVKAQKGYEESDGELRMVAEE